MNRIEWYVGLLLSLHKQVATFLFLGLFSLLVVSKLIFSSLEKLLENGHELD